MLINKRNEWRMPTRAECEDLIQNTTQKWTIQNGVRGMLFIGLNGNEIFVPAAGAFNDGELTLIDKVGGFWSSSLCLDWPIASWSLGFGHKSDDVLLDDSTRELGLPVRPVRSLRQN